MALSFLPDSDLTIEVVVTCDPAVTCSPEQMQAYLEAGELSALEAHEGATRFKIKALSPSDREQAAVRASAYTRSQLARLL